MSRPSASWTCSMPFPSSSTVSPSGCRGSLPGARSVRATMSSCVLGPSLTIWKRTVPAGTTATAGGTWKSSSRTFTRVPGGGGWGCRAPAHAATATATSATPATSVTRRHAVLHAMSATPSPTRPPLSSRPAPSGPEASEGAPRGGCGSGGGRGAHGGADGAGQQQGGGEPQVGQRPGQEAGGAEGVMDPARQAPPPVAHGAERRRARRERQPGAQRAVAQAELQVQRQGEQEPAVGDHGGGQR